MYYFAYGSNMSIGRLKERVPSAEFVCRAELYGHMLKFHKPSKKDGSGKCDAASSKTPGDCVWGAVFSILESELALLDRFEGQGYGYDRKEVSLATESIGVIKAQTYLATKFDTSLRPLDWYKEHVIRGAKAIGLPLSYIASIESVECDIDVDEKRRASELSIYNQ